jgi:hypothetical protein
LPTTILPSKCVLAASRRTPAIDASFQAGSPREQQQVAVVGVVIGMLVRQQDVAQLREANACRDELARDAVAAIDNVSDVVDHDHLRRGRVGFARPRAAARAQQDQSALAAVLVALAGCERGNECAADKRGRSLEDPSPGADQPFGPEWRVTPRRVARSMRKPATASCASASLVPAGNSKTSLASKGFATRSGSSSDALCSDESSCCAIVLEVDA